MTTSFQIRVIDDVQDKTARSPYGISSRNTDCRLQRCFIFLVAVDKLPAGMAPTKNTLWKTAVGHMTKLKN